MKESRSYAALWLGVLFLVVLTLAFILPLVPNDYWWYVRLGQEIVRTGGLPSVDTFSWSQAGQPVFYHSWLSALIFYGLHTRFGVDAVFLLRGLSLGITYAILWQLSRQAGAGPRLATLLVGLAALMGSGNWMFRPQLLAYPLFALALWVLYPPAARGKRLFLLPVIALAWVNLHGSYVLLLALIGASWAGTGPARRRALAGAGVASALATLVNPHGAGAWAYVWRMLTDPSSQQFSAEWLPPRNEGWQMGLFFAALLLMPLLTTVSRARWDRRQWLWYLGFGWLALSGVRYVIWFSLLLPPLAASLLAGWPHAKERPPQRVNPRLNVALAAALPLLSLLFLPAVRPTESLPVYSETPLEAAAWLSAHPELPGPLWADLTYSSYLVWAVPERPVWVDTRFEVYPPTQWERYRQIAEARWGWDAALQETGARLLFLSRQRQADLIEALEARGAWQRVYLDEETAIYVLP